MRVAQVVCTIPPYGGGIGVVSHYYARILGKRGHDVVVFTSCKKSKTAVAPEYYTIKYLWPWFRIGNAAAVPQLLWRLRKFDVVHLHAPFIGATFFIYLLKLFYGKRMKLVVSYHMDLVGAGVKKRLFNFYNKVALAGALTRADKIVVASLDYISNSRIRGFFEAHQDRFVEIPFGVRKEFQPEEKNPSLLSKYNISRDDTVVGFVGGLDSAHYFKGVDHLITAISKIDNKKVKLLVVGEGNLKKRYIALADKLGLKDRVMFAGYVEKNILPDHYNLFDIFVLPSIDKSEAFGLVLLEAMACGVPLVASNLKGVRSVVISGENGLLVEPKNPRDIASKLKYYLEHPELMNRLGQNGINLANEKYRWVAVVDQVEQLYRELLK